MGRLSRRLRGKSGIGEDDSTSFLTFFDLSDDEDLRGRWRLGFEAALSPLLFFPPFPAANSKAVRGKGAIWR